MNIELTFIVVNSQTERSAEIGTLIHFLSCNQKKIAPCEQGLGLAEPQIKTQKMGGNMKSILP